MTHEGTRGTHFALWAPNARRVSVVGDFNGWDGRRHVLRRRGATGVWEIFVARRLRRCGLQIRDARGRMARPLPLKADPVGFGSQHPPANDSIVRDITGYGLARRRLDEDARRPQRAHRPNFDLRGASGLLEAQGRGAPHLLQGGGGGTGRLRHRHGIHPSGAAADQRIPVRRVLGLPARGPFRPHRSATGRRTSSATWSMPRIRRAWGDPRLGAGAFPLPTRTGWRNSTARRSMSMPTRGRGSTRTGTRSSSTTAAARCGTT